MKPAYTSDKVDYFGVPRPLWRKIRKVLPKHKKSKHGGRPRIPDRAVINGIWYILWTGCQWKAVHRDWFGASSSVLHERFQTWQELGVFEKIMRRLLKYYAKRRNIKWKWQAIDSKTCPAPLGGEESGRNPTDRGKQGSKIHLLVDKRGAPLAVFISGANRHDKKAVVSLIASVVVPRPESEQHLCADKGYDYVDVRDFVVLEGYEPHIKRRRARGEAVEEEVFGLGEMVFPARRWVVERTLCWLAKRRSIRIRWAKKSLNWLAFVQFACAHILFNLAVSG